MNLEFPNLYEKDKEGYVSFNAIFSPEKKEKMIKQGAKK
jgi:hypothetical protein